MTASHGKLTFIGGGNMASSIVGGLLRNKWKARDIQVVDPLSSQREAIAELFKVKAVAQTDELDSPVSAIVLAVKPQIIPSVAAPLKAFLEGDNPPPIISIAAGLRLKQLNALFGDHLPIIRVMPNTPALVGAGASALLANRNCSDSHKALADSMMAAVGITAWVEQDAQMDTITALSGSGPAYFFYLMELMADAAEARGLNRELAVRFTLQTAVGSAMLAGQQDGAFRQLREQVTSPGGTTERALAIMQEYGMAELVRAAVNGAAERSVELGSAFGKDH